jgi:hypothetical protein
MVGFEGGGGSGGGSLELGSLMMGRGAGGASAPHEHHMRMMELAHQQHWASSMDAAWAAAVESAPLPHVAHAIGPLSTPWNSLPHYAAHNMQPVLPLNHAAPGLPAEDVIGSAIASASESIVRSLLQHHPQSPGSIHIPPPLQQLPPQAKSAFYRRATMLARHAGADFKRLHFTTITTATTTTTPT